MTSQWGGGAMASADTSGTDLESLNTESSSNTSEDGSDGGSLEDEDADDGRSHRPPRMAPQTRARDASSSSLASLSGGTGRASPSAAPLTFRLRVRVDGLHLFCSPPRPPVGFESNTLGGSQVRTASIAHSASRSARITLCAHRRRRNTHPRSRRARRLHRPHSCTPCAARFAPRPLCPLR